MRIAVAGGTGTVGRHVVAALDDAGHDAVVLSRTAGIDLLSGVGLSAALEGVNAVVDVTSTAASSATDSVRFFETVTRTLLDAEDAARVPHHVALSIVGAAKVNAGYYAGKKAQEDLVMAAGGRWSLLRATQFHEFPAQILGQGRVGPLQLVPTMVSQPIAAAEVGVALAELATGSPAGLAADLAGPRVERMSDLVRRYLVATRNPRPVLELSFPGAWWRGLRDGSTLPGPGARLGIQTFDEWLAELPDERA